MISVKTALCRAEEALRKDISSVVIKPDDQRYVIHNTDILAAPVEDNSLDVIVTDPPYARAHLDCWTKLAEFSAKKLKHYGSN